MKLNILVAVGVAFFGSASASATRYTFSVVSAQQSRGTDYSYIPNYQFNIDDAVVTFVDGGDHTRVNGVTTRGQRPALGSPGGDTLTIESYSFYTGDAATYGGGFDDGSADHAYLSDQLFAGTTAAPIFKTGTFSLFADDPSAAPAATLTITSDAATGSVPEPGTWATTMVGIGMVGVALRRRRQLGTACHTRVTETG